MPVIVGGRLTAGCWEPRRGPVTVALSTRIRFRLSLWLLRATVLLPRRPGGGRVLEETQETEELIERVAALDVGKAELTCCVRVPSPGKRGRRAGGPDLPDDDPLAAGHGRPAAGVGGDPGGDGGNLGLLEGGLLPAGSPRVPDLAGECPRRQAPPWAAQDRHAGCRLAVQARRAAAAAAQLRPPTGDPAAAGRGPLPGRSGGGPDRREAAGGAGCWRTPRSSSRWWPATASGCRGGPCWPRWSPASATPRSPAQLARTRLRAKLGPLVEAFCG